MDEMKCMCGNVMEPSEYHSVYVCNTCKRTFNVDTDRFSDPDTVSVE